MNLDKLCHKATCNFLCVFARQCGQIIYESDLVDRCENQMQDSILTVSNLQRGNTAQFKAIRIKCFVFTQHISQAFNNKTKKNKNKNTRAFQLFQYLQIQTTNKTQTDTPYH